MHFLVLFLSNVSVTSSIVMRVTGVDLLPVRKSMNGILHVPNNKKKYEWSSDFTNSVLLFISWRLGVVFIIFLS